MLRNPAMKKGHVQELFVACKCRKNGKHEFDVGQELLKKSGDVAAALGHL